MRYIDLLKRKSIIDPDTGLTSIPQLNPMLYPHKEYEMKIQVEFLLTHTSDIYDVGRVPCIGEGVVFGFDGECLEVKEVIHVLDANQETQVVAIVRVR